MLVLSAILIFLGDFGFASPVLSIPVLQQKNPPSQAYFAEMLRTRAIRATTKSVRAGFEKVTFEIPVGWQAYALRQDDGGHHVHIEKVRPAHNFEMSDLGFTWMAQPHANKKNVKTLDDLQRQLTNGKKKFYTVKSSGKDWLATEFESSWAPGTTSLQFQTLVPSGILTAIGIYETGHLKDRNTLFAILKSIQGELPE